MNNEQSAIAPIDIKRKGRLLIVHLDDNLNPLPIPSYDAEPPGGLNVTIGSEAEARRRWPGRPVRYIDDPNKRRNPRVGEVINAFAPTDGAADARDEHGQALAQVKLDKRTISSRQPSSGRDRPRSNAPARDSVLVFKELVTSGDFAEQEINAMATFIVAAGLATADDLKAALRSRKVERVQLFSQQEYTNED